MIINGPPDAKEELKAQNFDKVEQGKCDPYKQNRIGVTQAQ